jgi:maleylacetoacetate isomerase
VQPSLVLHGYWRSSSAYRVRIALELKGLRYRSEHVNLLAGEQRGDAHRARNPSGYVPALEVDGAVLVESVAIVEWLEEAFPTPPLLPRALLDRAHARALVETINAGTQPLQNLWVLNHFFGPDAEAKGAWARHVIARGLSAFEELVARHRGATGAGGPFSVGDAPTLADALLVPQLYNARRFQVDLAPYPHVVAIDAACAKLEAFARAHPDAQPDAKP